MAIRTDEEWLTVDEAAASLRVSKITLHRWIKQGRLPAFRLGPRKVRIRRADVGAVFTPAHLEPAGALEEHGALNIRPLTPEQRERQQEALREVKAFQQELLDQRNGVPFSSSVPLIRRSRVERSQQLS